MTESNRDIIFISKATPHDDAFALWLAPKLEAHGYKVFADVFKESPRGLKLSGGDKWRAKLTGALQNDTAKMLLCCSDRTLARNGVQEEITIAESVAGEISDDNFIVPLRLEPFKPIFGVGGLQFIDFTKGWAEGLDDLLDTLKEQNVPQSPNPKIQSFWAERQSNLANQLENSPEVMVSNWLRILNLPDELYHVVANNRLKEESLRQLASEAELPLVPFGNGFITFADDEDLNLELGRYAAFSIKETMTYSDFVENGSEALCIEGRDANNMIVSLFRQAWESNCKRLGLLTHGYSNGASFHIGKNQVGVGKRVSWGRQGKRRNSMLRNVSKGRLWEYGVSVYPSLFPYPHLRLKSRVLFSESREKKKYKVIDDKKVQFRLRRTVCSGWRNKAWHGRLMAFMELLAGESPYVDLSLGSGKSITLDGVPVEFTSPVTARQTNKQNEDAEESDPSTLRGFFEEDDA